MIVPQIIKDKYPPTYEKWEKIECTFSKTASSGKIIWSYQSMRQEKSTKLQPQEISTKQTYIYIYKKKRYIFHSIQIPIKPLKMKQTLLTLAQFKTCDFKKENKMLEKHNILY
jgi:hypothetical protein